VVNAKAEDIVQRQRADQGQAEDEYDLPRVQVRARCALSWLCLLSRIASCLFEP
jgi:hypothetical protein